MYAVTQNRQEYADQLRWLAHTMAEILAVLWVGFFAFEYSEVHKAKWPPDLFVQGGLLAVIFAGYAIGWRKEKLGGWIAILGTAALFAALAITNKLTYQGVHLVWFAVPGALYLMARHYDRRLADPAA